MYRPAVTKGGFVQIGFHRHGGDEADAYRPFRIDLGPDKGRCLAGAVSGCWVNPVLDRAREASVQPAQSVKVSKKTLG